MIKLFRYVIILCAIPVLAISSNAFAQTCAAGKTSVQILGSAGPFITPDRASSSYLLWVGGKAKMLVDMGGGAYLRFGQSKAKLSDLAMVGISHLHPDHVSDLPALLWLSHRMRKNPLPIFGPSAGKGVPSPRGIDYAPEFSTFLSRLFDPKTGAFMVMGGTLGTKKRNGVRLDVGVIDVLKSEPSAVFEGQGLKVTAIGIPHANMPTLAYRVETSDGSVVFSSDQTGTCFYAPEFSTFLSRQFDPKTGAFMVMGGTLGTKKRNGVRLDVGVIDVLKSEPSAVFEGQGLKVTAIGIPHANMPTLAYRVETSDGSVVFSSDQTGTNPKFIDFAKNANVLIMHMQTPVGAKNVLHAAPAVVGRVAQAAQVGRLIVSHIGPKGAKLKAAIAEVKKTYKGPVTIGADLQCTPVAG